VASVNHQPDLSAFLQPYPTKDYQWRIVAYLPDEGLVEAAFIPTRKATEQRLTNLYGPGGWACTAQVGTPGELLVTVSISGAARSVFITRGPGETAEASLERGFVLAALEFTAGAKVPRTVLEFDPETGQAFDYPEPPGHVPAAVPTAAPAAAPAPQQDDLAAGRELIGRLIDRLQAEGLGHEAAKLVAASAGYGKNADEARALYRQLRGLLQQHHGTN